MSQLHLPNVPDAESRSFKQRILAKYEAYLAYRAAGKSNAVQDQGERYEIAVALHLYRNHLLNQSDYLSRKSFPGEIGAQSIHMGHNNEYDFVLPDSASDGLLLGDAKSDHQGLGEPLKKAISFCLLDFHVRQRETNLAGFCFATPAPPDRMFRTALRNAVEILTTLSECSGITGMNSQLIPTDVKIFFRSRYLPDNLTIREDALLRDPQLCLKELHDVAGFTFQFLQVPPMDETMLALQMQMLSTKQRWRPPGHTA
jgi:hypothetical protein